MATNKETKTAQYLRDTGFTVLVEKKTNVTMSTRLTGVLACMENRASFEPSVSDHKKRIDEFYTRGAVWCGGTEKQLLADLSGQIDMRPFEEAKQKFQASSLAVKLREKFEKCQPRRKRCKSEFDGEFNYDRRDDLQPFDGVKRSTSDGRAIDVIVYGSVSSSTNSKELDAYGNMVWALIDIIEQAGVNARVLIRYQQKGYLSESNGTLTINVETKKAGEYIAPSLMAATFKSNFFRRAIFQQIVMGADVVGEKVGYGLGTPRNAEKKIEFKNGELIIAPEIRNAGFEEIEQELLKAIA
jgi:hypothetical protein